MYKVGKKSVIGESLMKVIDLRSDTFTVLAEKRAKEPMSNMFCNVLCPIFANIDTIVILQYYFDPSFNAPLLRWAKETP